MEKKVSKGHSLAVGVVLAVLTLLISSCSNSSSQSGVGEGTPAASATPTATLPNTPTARVIVVPKTAATRAPDSSPTETPEALAAQSIGVSTKAAATTKAEGGAPAGVTPSDAAQTDVPTATPLTIDTPTATAVPTAVDTEQRAAAPTVTPTPPEATGTPTPTPAATGATPTPTPTPAASEATATLTPTTSPPTPTPTETPESDDDDDDRPPPTFTPTAIPDDVPEGWSFSNTTYLYTVQGELDFLSIWGEVFNNTGADQHLLAIAARVRDQEGTLIADAYNTVGVIPVGTLVQGRRTPFQLEIYLPEREFDPAQLTYEFYVESMDAWYETREDLTIIDHSWTATDGIYEIEGTLRNRGPALTTFVRVIVALYGADGNVVGVDWFHEVDPAYLAPGVVEFSIVTENVPVEVASYELQALGR